MRRFAWLAAVLALAGCGGGAVGSHTGAPAGQVAATDQPAPNWVGEMLDPPPPSTSTTAGDVWTCMVPLSTDGATTSPPCQVTPALQAQLEAQQKQWLAAIQPSAGSEPRTVAVLPLSGGGTASFVAWQTAAGPCWTTGVESGSGGGGGGPEGPCTRAAEPSSRQPPCDALCLSSSGGGGSDGSTTFVLAGTVPIDPDTARVTFADGAQTTVPLDGPVLPGSPDRRIFMLELGSSDSWRKVELLQGGSVTKTLAMPAQQAAAEDCTAKIGEPPRFQPTPGLDPAAAQQAMQQAFGPYDHLLTSCIRHTLPSSQALPTTTP